MHPAPRHPALHPAPDTRHGTWHQAINRRRGLTRIWRRVVQPRSAAEPIADADSRSPLDRLASVDPTPEQAAADDQLRRGIQQSIRALSPKLRDALLLAQSGAYSYEEIGAMLKVPTGTIKWRVSEARKIIRQQLRERGYGDVV